MASLILKQIERGSTSFAGTDTTKTITLTTTLTNTSKTILLFSAKSGSGSPVDFQILGRVLSTTQIQFERAGAPSVAADVEYQVIEFSQGITVQHFNINPTAATTNTTITSVTLSKAFVITSLKITGTTYGSDDCVAAQITSTTNLALVTDNFTAALWMAVQVVEIDDASVQEKTGSYGTGTTADITVTTIDPANTFWFFSARQTTGGVVGNDLPYLGYVNTTTLRFTRTGAAGVNWTYVAYVVSLSAGVTVQNVTTSIASGGNTISPTIPNSIVVANTAINLNGINQRYLSSTGTDDDAGTFSAALSGLTTTAFTATRTDSPAIAANGVCQVMQFTKGGPNHLSAWDGVSFQNINTIDGVPFANWKTIDGVS